MNKYKGSYGIDTRTKTLAIILNHNLPELTNWLYYTIKPHKNELFDLIVMDNGSKPELTPKYAQIKLKSNLYWGGALNVAFKMVLENPIYDSLLFLNNDIDLTPEVFISALRNELFYNDFAIVTPCIAGRAAPWKQMQNWASKETRVVKWIDMQAPLFHRKVIETIGQFHPDLYYGWGQELVCFDVCTENGWKTGVCDHISIIHIGKQTIKQNRLFSKTDTDEDVVITLPEANAKAIEESRDYFTRYPLKNESFDELREYGKTYTFHSHPVQPRNNNQTFRSYIDKIVKKLQ